MTTKHYVVQTTDPSIATTELAVREMIAAGFATTWLATLEQYTDRHRKTRTLKASLFPGYLFVEFDIASAAWRRIVSCRGVRKILGASPVHPISLPLGAVDRLRTNFEAGEFVPKPEPDLAVGERLTMIAGAFAGHIGVCHLSKGERVEVMFRVFGEDRLLPMRRDMVRRAS